MSPSVCIGRFHDGSAKPNWGGRATSAALARVAVANGYEVTSVINGLLIVKGLGTDAPSDHMRWAVGEAQRRLPMVSVRPMQRYSAHEFLGIAARAKQLLRSSSRSPQLQSALDALERADEFWMNGEGDLILLERPTLYRTLLLVHLAAEMGKTVRMVNSMLSAPPTRPPVPEVVTAVGAALAACTTVRYRDPVSLDLHRALYPDVEADWRPDALFAWGRADTLAAIEEDLDLGFGPTTERLPIAVDALIRQRTPYVVVSGSSALSGIRARSLPTTQLTELLGRLRRIGLLPIVVSMCSGDDWMLPVAAEAGAAVVPASIPLISAMVVVGRASCVLSGRYHPSVLAAVSGTGTVLTASNSHKNSSLQQVLGETDAIEHATFGSALDMDALVAATADVAATAEAQRDARRAHAHDLGAQLFTEYVTGRAAELAPVRP